MDIVADQCSFIRVNKVSNLYQPNALMVKTYSSTVENGFTVIEMLKKQETGFTASIGQCLDFS